MKSFVAALVLVALAWGSAWGTEAAYRLAPGDAVLVSVWRDDTLSRELVVPPDGVVSLPLVGDLDVRSMTVPALRDEVRRRLDPFVPDPEVTVVLLKAASLTAFVIGKVHKPGQYPVGLDTTVLQLLAMAGGLNPYAAGAKIAVLRRDGGRTLTLPFDYTEVEKSRNLEQNVVVRRGDVVVVP